MRLRLEQGEDKKLGGDVDYDAFKAAALAENIKNDHYEVERKPEEITKSIEKTEKEIGVIGGGIDEFIYGYVNGILDANITKEMKECDYWKQHAEKSFNTAYDLI